MSGEKHHELNDRRRGRNLATLAAIGLLAAMIFSVTILKLQQNAASPFAEQFNPQIDLMRERARQDAQPPASPPGEETTQ